MAERCPVTDLLPAQCDHCRTAGQPRQQPDPSLPTMTAAFESACMGCGSWIHEGDPIWRVDGVWVDKECAT